MLKEQAKLFNRLSLLVDLLLVGGALVLAYLVRRRFAGMVLPLHDYLWVLLAVFPVWYVLLQRAGLHASIRRLSPFEIFARLVNVHLTGGLAVAAVIYFVDRDRYSRGLYLAFIGLSFLLLALEKVGLRLTLGFFRRRGFNTRNLLIVGTREKARRFCELVREHADWGLKVAGFVQVARGPVPGAAGEYPVLGRIDELVEVCKRELVDEVVFCLSKDFVVDAEAYLRDLEELGVTVRMVLDFYDIPQAKRELSLFHDELPILTFHTKSLDAQQLFLKRTIDIAGALAGLAVTAVLLPFIALAIRLDSRGPVFFGQQRVGEGGRMFRCWKFRSMAVDAEAQKAHLAGRNEMKGAIFKIRDDPRVTRVGRLLRRTSLDELPQFWNVLKGEMSLVGTRPPTVDEVARYENWHRRRISIKPGITGLWQVSGRSRVEDFDEIVRLDLKYIDTWSLWLDLKLLARTLVVVFARQGSC